ncbi:MAG: heme ABC exporter ATP-binding protein CcmA [Myxococcales bacterium]|nr:heme ABC exporter ATP-binding protein CcmA [Myxococcales bacterium]MCB9568102.1 heme ABC exporter ATP-binding protein CcmA [Myxococcales bacterium]MCB9705328.1 heme ABC exporter ATP-binding protein CcmA [Myxococcales bacterium]
MSAPITPLEARGLSQRFGRKRVLRRVDLRLDGGEIVGLVGANGAGKTTLFSILSGLMAADEGERRLGGQAVDELSLELRARFAYVAHRPQVYAGLSARENLELAAGLRASVGAETLPSDQALARFGLSDAADRLVGAFSRGMAQRLALARAFAARPEVLILDEPFTALDRQGRELLAEILADERARGAAILLSSHDHEMLARVADRILHLEGGVIAGEVRRGDDDPDGERFRLAALALWSGPAGAAEG